ncbi:hypothetical protein CHS0354_014241 [Potamilus streckersoni]|uniref:Uncharacterized protein n=1 Tax=Potamilus streckersoni TaxID=2493646 RepID=A0AAE0SAQ8_9BIVA|nr:hypothetical protein CHS0354_014241 [Potamilus streckersoni]
MSRKLNLTEYVEKVLEAEKMINNRFLDENDLEKLLEDCSDRQGKDCHSPRETIIGYPSHPLYREIGNMFQIWMETKHCPILDLPSYDLLDEKEYVESRAAILSSISPLLEGLETLHEIWSEDEIKFRVREIMQMLGKRGLLDLLGIRKTVGTKDLWPPSRQKLEASFTQKHSAKSELSVGARALAKHHHRDQSSSWWGTSTGTEQEKNEYALNIVNKILDEATWINIHWLPNDVFVIEARLAEGYGARWTADGENFRGFLEPQMVDGHEVGWKH